MSVLARIQIAMGSGKTLSGEGASGIVTGVDPIVATEISPGDTAVSLLYDGTTLTLDGMGRLHATGLSSGGVLATIPLVATAGVGNVTLSLNEGASVQNVSNNLEVKTTAIVDGSTLSVSSNKAAVNTANIIDGSTLTQSSNKAAVATSAIVDGTTLTVTSNKAAVATSAIVDGSTLTVASNKASVATSAIVDGTTLTVTSNKAGVNVANIVDGTTIVATGNKVTGNYSTTDPHLTITGAVIATADVASASAVSTFETATDASILAIDTELALHATEISANTAGIAANTAAILTKQPLNAQLTDLSASPPFVDLTTAGAPLTVESTTATTSQTTLTAIQGALATGNTTSVQIGTATTTNNGAQISFQNVGGSGSSGNLAKFGVIGGPALSIDGSGTTTANGTLMSTGTVVANASASAVAELLTATTETYTIGTSSGRSGVLQSGTVVAIEASTGASASGGALIDFLVPGSTGGNQDVFIGAVGAGSGGDSAANFVIGRRTGTSNWAESMKIDQSGNVSMDAALNVVGTASAAAPTVGPNLTTKTYVDAAIAGAGGSFQPVNQQLTNLSQSPPFIDLTTTGGPFNVKSTTSTTTGTLATFLQGSLGTGNSTRLALGTANNSNNAAVLSFNNVGGGGSASNTLSMGVFGAPALIIDGSGNETVAGSLNVSGAASVTGTIVGSSTLAVTDSVTTASETMGSFLQPSVATGNATTLIVGAANTANNAGRIRFVNSSGSGSTSNSVQIGLVGANTLGIDGNGNVAVPGIFSVAGNSSLTNVAIPGGSNYSIQFGTGTSASNIAQALAGAYFSNAANNDLILRGSFDGSANIRLGTALTSSLDILGTGAVVSNVLFVASAGAFFTSTSVPVSITDTSTTATRVMQQIFQTALGTGNATQFLIGATNSNFNSGFVRFVNAGGTGSVSNTLEIGMQGGSSIVIDGNDHIYFTGQLVSTLGYSAGVIYPSVSNDVTSGSAFSSTDTAITATAHKGFYQVTAHIYLASNGPAIAPAPNVFTGTFTWGAATSPPSQNFIIPAAATNGITATATVTQISFTATIGYPGGTANLKFVQQPTLNNNVQSVSSFSSTVNHHISWTPLFG